MSDRIPLIVHMSDEAGIALGGIGTVFASIFGTRGYQATVERTLLVGPFDTSDTVALERLTDYSSRVNIAYSSYHAIYQGVSAELRSAFQAIEQRYGVALLYGTRSFGDFVCELLLIDARQAVQQEVNAFKFACWENFGLDSARHSWNAGYNAYMGLAPPLLQAIEAVAPGPTVEAHTVGAQGPRFLLAHDSMALPLVLAAQIYQPGQWCTIFYAHEVSTARRLVEEKPGHDTAFYNVLYKAREWNLSLEAVYGSQDHDYRHALLRLATRCDAIFAVSDVVVDELRFLGGRFTGTKIDVVYNGSRTTSLTLAEKVESKALLQSYAERLLGYRPDYVFTHVARMVLSKAFWRDLRLLDHLEAHLRKRGQTAVLFVLATSLPAGRRPQWVYAWEEQYGWPVVHRADNGDLVGLERVYYDDNLLPFNQRSQNLSAVLVNQFGWSRDRCGVRMPPAMTQTDLRHGSDLEFGQSIYEPFGIPQVEAIGTGSLSCVSSMCGCVGFGMRAAGNLANLPNLVVADYVTLPNGYWVGSPYDALNIDQSIRDWIEGNNSERAAHLLAARLPQNQEQQQALLDSGCVAAHNMGWNTVVDTYLLPALWRLCS